MLDDYRIPPSAGGRPGRAVVFLHGVGDSGRGGLLTIGQIWGKTFPDCEFLCPDAPFAYDMAPPDFGGRQWFSLQSFAADRILDGAQKAAPLLDAYLDHVLETRNLVSENLALVGFSQGTIMALYVAPRRLSPVACVIGYAGLLTGGASLRTEKKSTPPVLLVHGKKDEVVPYGSMEVSEKALKLAGIPVTTVTSPLAGHTIDDLGLNEGLKFLKSVWRA